MHTLCSLRSLLQAAILQMCINTLALAAEPPAAPILRIDPAEHTAIIKRIASDEAGRYLVTASDDKTARVWRLADGRLLRTLRIPIGNGNEGKLYAVALSPDGQTVALGGWTDDDNSVYLFDRASGRLLRRLSGLPNVVQHLAFSPDGYTLAATLFGSHGLRLFNVSDGRLLAEDRDYGADSYSVHFSPVAGQDALRLVTTSWDGFLRLYRFADKQLTLLVKVDAPGGQQPFAARFSPDGTRIAVGFNDSSAVNVLYASDLSLSWVPDTVGIDSNLASVAWSRQGDFLYAGGAAQASFENRSQIYIRRWPGHGKAAFLDTAVAGGTIMDLVALPAGGLVFGSAEPSWGVLNAEGQRTLFHAPVGADFRAIFDGFALSVEGAQVRFGYGVYGQSPVVFDSQQRAFVSGTSLAAPLFSVPGLNVSDWKNHSSPKLNGTALKLKQFETSRSLAFLPKGDGFALGAEWWLRLFDQSGNQRWQQAAPGSVWGLNVSQDGRWVVAAYGDGTIRWHRVSDGVEQLALFPHADKKRWVMWTPSGYYDASPGAENLIGWHVNHGKELAADFFPASRLRESFNRPDVLNLILKTQDESEALRVANAESGRQMPIAAIAELLPPVVEIISPAMDSAVPSRLVKVRYLVRTLADAPVTAMRVRVNGKAVNSERALKYISATNDDIQEIEVAIQEQDNEIALFAENKNGVSTAAVLRVTWAGDKSPISTASPIFKPNLYVLAVGISNYQNPDYNLQFAAKDALDFAAVFHKQKGRLYRDVVIKLLTNDKASKDDVLDGLEWLKRQVTSRDVGMMFLAGHGMNDNVGNYFFLPHNAEPDKLVRTGVAQADIKLTLNSLPGKAIFFVDSCHSGNVLGPAKTRFIGGTTDAFVNELASAENGVVVFSSSTGKQYSQENPAWGNGAFTKAVVEGLTGKADFTKSGKITHKSLDYYISERVKELTNGQQSPVSISPEGITDFPIAVVEQ